MTNKKPNSRVWIWCLLLALPSLIPLATHFWYAHQAGETATGFIQNDQPYYMANAREFFDGGSFSPTYKNPNDWRSDSPKIYFQPQSLLLGSIRQVTGADPALIFSVFGFVFGVLAIRVAWSLLHEFLPDQDNSSLAVFVMFIWGGGIFAFVGLLKMFLAPQDGLGLYDYLTLFDPFQGWWFLNLGRNLVFPMESYYHFLFLLGALMLVRGKHAMAVGVGLLLSISHPFTGVEYLGIALLWLFLERGFWKQESVPRWAIVATAFLLVAHVGYYQVWLGRFPSHREIHETWQLAWEYKAINMILGYGLVAAFAIWRFRDSILAADFLSSSKNRLLLAWFVGAFLLANHEFFMKSTQPLHFTRGYVWTPIFLAGAVSIHHCVKYFDEKTIPFAIPLLIMFMLFDNATWLCVCQTDGRNNSAHSKTDITAVMAALNEIPHEDAVVVSNSRLLSYLATVYTPHDSFAGHGYLTPHINKSRESLKNLIEDGQPVAMLKDYPQLVVLDRNAPFVNPDDFPETVELVRKAYQQANFTVQPLVENDDFVVWHCLQAQND